MCWLFKIGFRELIGDAPSLKIFLLMYSKCWTLMGYYSLATEYLLLKNSGNSFLYQFFLSLLFSISSSNSQSLSISSHGTDERAFTSQFLLRFFLISSQIPALLRTLAQRKNSSLSNDRYLSFTKTITNFSHKSWNQIGMQLQ